MIHTVGLHWWDLLYNQKSEIVSYIKKSDQEMGTLNNALLILRASN